MRTRNYDIKGKRNLKWYLRRIEREGIIMIDQPKSQRWNWKNLKATAGTILFLIVLAGFGIQIAETMPGNAIVLIDPETKTYFAPHYFVEQDVLPPRYLGRMTLKQARQQGYKFDTECRNFGYFVEDDAPIIRELLGWSGIMKERLHRWNPDGTWNY